jgi:acyl carrier protein
MLPSYYIQIPELPLTVNGKVDKRKLPDPKEAGMFSGKEYVSPRNETERRLVKLWSNVLSQSEEKLGVKDNFFELGGHSLKATRLMSQIYKEFEVKVELKYLFQYPDIESIANEIGRLIWVQDSQKIEEKDSNIESIYF